MIYVEEAQETRDLSDKEFDVHATEHERLGTILTILQ